VLALELASATQGADASSRGAGERGEAGTLERGLQESPLGLTLDGLRDGTPRRAIDESGSFSNSSLHPRNGDAPTVPHCRHPPQQLF
jgi:hypothetical protein